MVFLVLSFFKFSPSLLHETCFVVQAGTAGEANDSRYFSYCQSELLRSLELTDGWAEMAVGGLVCTMSGMITRCSSGHRLEGSSA